MDFLKKEIAIRERPEDKMSYAGSSVKGHRRISLSHGTGTQSLTGQHQHGTPRNLKSCPFCLEFGVTADHHPGSCENGKRLSPKTVLELIKKTRRCFVCFSLHPRRLCRANAKKCPPCGLRHNALLPCDTLAGDGGKPPSCKYTQRRDSPVKESGSCSGGCQKQQCRGQSKQVAPSTSDALPPSAAVDSPATSSTGVTTAAPTCPVLLQTAVVDAVGQTGAVKRIRILFDTGSDRTYVSSALARQLNCLPSGSDDLTVFAFGGVQVASRTSIPCVELRLRDTLTGSGVDVRALTTDRICVPPRLTPASIQSLPFLKNVRLADPPTSGNPIVEVSALVGSDFLPYRRDPQRSDGHSESSSSDGNHLRVFLVRSCSRRA
jgi:hypothetical protein